jgi:hypothetical protein
MFDTFPSKVLGKEINEDVAMAEYSFAIFFVPTVASVSYIWFVLQQDPIRPKLMKALAHFGDIQLSVFSIAKLPILVLHDAFVLGGEPM